MIGNLYCHSGNMKEGRKELLQTVQTYSFHLKYLICLISTLFTSAIYIKLAYFKRKLSDKVVNLKRAK